MLYEKFITSALHSYHTASVAAVTAAAIALGVLAIACVFCCQTFDRILGYMVWFGFGLKCNIVTSDYVVTNDGCYHHLTYVNRVQCVFCSFYLVILVRSSV